MDLVPTLLAAHETPPEYRALTGIVIVDLVCEEIIPATAEEGLALFLRRLL